MGSSRRVCVLGAAADPVAVRWASALRTEVVAGFPGVLTARPEVVLARVPVEALGRVALLATVAGAAAVVASPVGPAGRLPAWERRFHRFLLPGQADVRGWAEAGIALGRMVVVEPGPDEGEALRAAIHEVRAMALRPDIRRRAR